MLQVGTDDPTQPTATIPLEASSAAGSARVTPLAIEFGRVTPSCRSGPRTISIHSFGRTAVVDAISLDPTSSSEFELGTAALPATVGANQTMQVPIRYRPSGEGEDFGILSVTIDGVARAVPLHGTGTTVSPIEVQLAQSPASKTDVLFVVNNTNTTSAERDRLGQAIQPFFLYAQAQGIDFRVAMMSMEYNVGDRGRFLAEPPQREKVITPQSVDPVGTFRSNLDNGGNGNTGGFEAAFLALSDPLLNTDDAGFLRPEGLLTVIFVSDEDDQSQGDVAAYQRHLATLKAARGGRFQALAIAGTDPNDCQSAFGAADYSPAYLALAEETGGISQSFCQDWNLTVPAIAPYAFGRTRRFPIDGAPVSTSIEVRVDNDVIPRTDAQGNLQWTYSAQSGAILFSEEAAPDFGAQVRIAYALECL